MGLSRRDLMKNAGMLAVGTGFGGLALSMAHNAIAQTADKQAGCPIFPGRIRKSTRSSLPRRPMPDTTKAPAAMGYSKRSSVS